jgi:hypothetical protein
VDEFLDTNPILWISSSVWFSFLSRRLKIIYEAHRKLWVKPPPNYGVISGLYAFLMQSVIFTPPRINSYIRDTLAGLNYKQNCDRFGMFFLDLNDPLQMDAIPEIGVAEVLRELKLTTFRHRKTPPERLLEDNSEYPLGEAPTRKEIILSLRSNPTTLIPIWEEPLEIDRYTDCEPRTPEGYAVEIFIRFTCHLWILLHPFWRTRPEITIKPRTLADALRYWSVDFILEEIDDVDFRLCHSVQHSGPGRPSMSFSERRTIYFPVESKGLPKVWKHLLEPPGYISTYQNRCMCLGPDDKKTLDECLEELLDLCQCLPDSSRAQSGGCIWSVKQKKIVVLTNPVFYKIKKIGKEPSTGKMKARRSAPAQRGMKSIVMEMMVQAEIPRDVAEKAYRLTKKHKARIQRSAKSKNRRKPPQRKRKDEDEDEDEEDEERYLEKKRKRGKNSEKEEERHIRKKMKRIEEEDDDWSDEKDRGSEGDDEEEEEENDGSDIESGSNSEEEE